MITEERPDRIPIHPAVALPIETYTMERRAEFLLSTATDREDYARAAKVVRDMGLDPEAIQHRNPERK